MKRYDIPEMQEHNLLLESEHSARYEYQTHSTPNTHLSSSTSLAHKTNLLPNYSSCNSSRLRNNKSIITSIVKTVIIVMQLSPVVQAQLNNVVSQQNYSSKLLTKPVILSDQNFTFNKNGSYLQIDATKEWPFNARKEISFRFKTKSPHGLLIYQTFDHSKLAREDELEPADPVHVSSTSSVLTRTRLKLIKNGVTSKSITDQIRVSRSIEPIYHKRFKQHYEDEADLSKLPSNTITATASEKLVNSIFSSSPAAAINGNLRISPVQLPIRDRSSTSSVKDSTRNFHLLDGLESPDLSQKASARVNYGSHPGVESKDGTTVLSASTISSFSASIYELYLKLENGRLKIMFEYGSRLNQTFCGKGLNDDRWHKVNLKVDPETNQMLLVLDQMITVDISLGPLVEDEATKRNELFFTNSVLYVGGLNNDASTVKNIKQRLYMAQFIGCIGQILLKTDQAIESSLQPAPIESMVLVELGCINKCDTDNYCLHESPCVNLYSSTKCDCFGTKYEDTYCWQDQLTTISMLGHSILVYRIYDWKDRHHSSINRFSMQFRTLSLDSILFFASGDLSPQLVTKSYIATQQQPPTSSSPVIQIPLVLAPSSLANFSSIYRPINSYQNVGSTNYLAVSLSNGSLVVEINFGDQPILLSSFLYDTKVYGNRTANKQLAVAPNLADGKWHNVTVIHNYKHLSLHLDNQIFHTTIVGKNHHLYLDPNIYVGSVPNLLYNDTRVLLKPFDLRHKFIGCLRSVYFNQYNILLDLKKKSPMTEYRDILNEPQFGPCSLQHPSYVPVTLRSGKSYLTFALTPDPQAKPVNRAPDQRTVVVNQSTRSPDESQNQVNSTVLIPKGVIKIEFDYKTPLQSHFLSGGYLKDLSFPDLGGFWALYASENCQLYLIINSGLTSQHDQIIEISPNNTSCDSDHWHRISMSMVLGDKSINITRTKQESSIADEGDIIMDKISSFAKSNLTDDTTVLRSYKLKSSVELIHQVQFGGDIGKFGESTTVPFTGCIRRININEQLFDSRELVSDFLPKSFSANMSNTAPSSSSSTDTLRAGFVLGGQVAQGYITLDSCRLVNHCASMNPCQNNGTCKINNLGEPECDCTRTGYVGKRCQFSIYKQSCQDIYLTGQRKSSYYLIDLDRNGPLGPIKIRCNMEGGSGQIETILSHNLPHEYLVKSSSGRDLIIDITYAAFQHYYAGMVGSHYYADDDNEEPSRSDQDLMLRSLIGQSSMCKQYIRYECRSAPLELGSRTWFETPYPKTHKLISLDGSNRGKCFCASSEKSCINPNKSCNCDSNEPTWTDDSYELTNHNDVGITRIVILRQQLSNLNLPINPESQSRFTLGDLKCLGNKRYENQHEITFKTSGAYIEVPGWRKGDISFSFRTASNPPAIILFQLATSRNHGYLRLTLIADSRLLFEFIVNRKPRRLYLTASHKLNNGEWQQVFIEYNSFNLRLSVNDDSTLIELDMNDYLGTFEGPLFIGGAPSKYLMGELAKRNGFTGCFRGLYIDGQSIDLKSYLNPAMPTVISACKPSCTKNLCQNGGKCIEYWGSYECECANPIAHSGSNCEINLNTNSITFQTEKSYYVQVMNDSVKYPTYLVKNILLNIRTYQETALVLYISDHLNNFIQIHKNRSSLVLTFNSNDTIIMAQVPIDKTPEVEGLPEAGDTTSVTMAAHLADSNVNRPNLDKKNTTSSQPNSKDYKNTTLELSMIDKSIRVSNTSGSGEPIQIKIGRQRTHTTFLVNNNYLIIEQPIILLTNYTQNPWTNPELESVRPPRPKIGSKTYFQIFLANIDDYFTTRLPGFTGCIQGLSIDNQPFDFNRAHLTGEFNGDYRIGCKMHCDLFPCKNQGVCIENWKEDKIQCKCDTTSYVGRLCDEDIAAVFNGHTSYFIYHPSNSLLSGSTLKTNEQKSKFGENRANFSDTKGITSPDKNQTKPSVLVNEIVPSVKQVDVNDLLNVFEVSMAFSTDSTQSQLSVTTPNHLNRVQVLILMTIANSTRHFFLGITADGSLLIQEDYGGSMSLSRLIKPPDHTFNDGHRHMIRYTRYNQTIHINVDYQTYLPTLSVINTSHIHRHHSSVILVGTVWGRPSRSGYVHLNDSSTDTNYMNYSGCISNLAIKMDNILIEPFSEAFGHNIETAIKLNESKNDTALASSDSVTGGTSGKSSKSGTLLLLEDEMRAKGGFTSDTLGIDKLDSRDQLNDKLVAEVAGDSMEVIQTKDVEQGKCASFKKSEAASEKKSTNEPRLTYLQETRPIYTDPPKLKVYERTTREQKERRESLLKIGPMFYASLALICSVSLSALAYAYVLHVRYKSEKFRCDTPFFHNRNKASQDSK